MARVNAPTTALNVAASPGRDPFMPQAPKGRAKALALALFAHALLLLAIAFGVNWRSSEPATVAAELWSATPQAAAPRAAQPPPVPAPVPAPEPKRPEPLVKRAEPVLPAPKPEPALPDPQIALEKAKRDAEKKREKIEREQAEREKQQAKEALAQKKLKTDRLQAEKDRADRERREAAATAAEKSAEKAAEKAEKAEKADAAKLAALRDANLKRMLGQAGASGGPTDVGTAARSSGPSDSYAGRIVARIKPNIVFTDPVDGNPVATVEVKLAPDGTIIGKRLLKSSGVKSWDDAVLRAIERTEILPRDVDGRVPPPFPISFKLRD